MVAEPPLLLLLALLDALEAGAAALELELELLEPQAAIPSAATTMATALVRRVLTVISLVTRCQSEFLGNRNGRCYSLVNRSLSCCLHSADNR